MVKFYSSYILYYVSLYVEDDINYSDSNMTKREAKITMFNM